MVKTCPQCGATNRDDATFCSSCGVSFAAPTVKPVPSVRVVRPGVPTPAPVRVPPPGMCYYHPSLPAQYVCSRCGRPICRDDCRFYGDLILCPQCYAGIYPLAVPMQGPGFLPTPGFPPTPPMPMAGPMAGPIGPSFIPPRPRALWGFLMSLMAGILAILAGAVATAIMYANIGLVPAWLANYWMVPIGVGMLLGLVIILGAFLIWQGYSTLGGILVFVFSLANIYLAILMVIPVTWVYAGIALGIVALVIGMVGGILGILSK